MMMEQITKGENMFLGKNNTKNLFDKLNFTKKQIASKKRLATRASIQNQIYYEMMLRDGLCLVDDSGIFSACIKFDDINYNIAKLEDQKQIFMNWMETLNSLSNENNLALYIQNRIVDQDEFRNAVMIPPQEDNLQVYRDEWNDILQEKLKMGNNRIVTDKYIIYNFVESDIEEARKFANYHSDEFIRRLSSFNVKSQQVDGQQRLAIMNRALYPDKKMTFSYDHTDEVYQTTKDAICPDELTIKTDHFTINGRYGRVLYIKDYSTECSDELLHQITKIESNLNIVFNMKVMPRGDDTAMMKNKIASIEAEIGRYQRTAFKYGIDPELAVPKTIRDLKKETEEELDSMVQNNQRLFECQFLIMLNCETWEELEVLTKQIQNIANKRVIDISPLRFQQLDGLNACLPLGYRVPKRSRTLTSSACSVFIPFSVQELQERNNSIYYGINTVSKNVISENRKRLSNANAWYLGESGSGKSMACKREMWQVYLKMPQDELIVLDPHNEYHYVADELGGTTINIDSKSGVHINPLEYDASQQIHTYIKEKADFCQTFISEIFQEEMSAEEKSMIDSATRSILNEYFIKKKAGSNVEMPTLKTLWAKLLDMNNPHAMRIANGLEMYVNGSYDLFSGQTTSDINARFTVYNIFDTEKTIQPLAMLVLLESIKSKIFKNSKRGIHTWVWIDEIYLLFKNEQSALFLYELFKYARKFGGNITGITQNVTDLSQSPTANTMLSNSAFVVMLSQSEEDKLHLGNLLHIDQEQLSFLSTGTEGSGLIYTGKRVVIPFKDSIPQNTRIYRCMTSKPDERREIDKEKEVVEHG